MATYSGRFISDNYKPHKTSHKGTTTTALKKPNWWASICFFVWGLLESRIITTDNVVILSVWWDTFTASQGVPFCQGSIHSLPVCFWKMHTTNRFFFGQNCSKEHVSKIPVHDIYLLKSNHWVFWLLVYQIVNAAPSVSRTHSPAREDKGYCVLPYWKEKPADHMFLNYSIKNGRGSIIRIQTCNLNRIGWMLFLS